MFDNINFLSDVGQWRLQAIISYKKVLNYLEKENQDDESLYKFGDITDHCGPLKKNDPNYNGSLYNVMDEWETVEITEEPLSIIDKDDPVTCAAYAFYTYLNGINSNIYIQTPENLTKAINQTKIRQVRRDQQHINLGT